MALFPENILAEWITPLNIVGLFAAYLSWKSIYALYLSPLRNVPGPLFAKLTGGYPFFVDMAGHRAKTIESLHRKYGPVVQFGPNEVSFDSIEAIDIIYGPQTDCIKSPWYDSVTRDGVFKLRHIAEHRDRRKRISRAFSPASAYELEPNVASLVQNFIAVIERRRQNGPLEMRHWFRMLAFDLSGAAFVGAPYGGLEAEENPQFLSDMENAFLIWDLEGRFPLLMWFVERIPSKSLQHFFNGIDRLYRFSADVFAKYIKNYGRSPNRKDIVAKLIQKTPDSVQGLTDYQLSCEIANLTFAATDTTSIVLSFVFWELALHSDKQEHLRTELKNAKVDTETGVPTHQSLVNLPYLNAVINETMRLHSPIPMGLLRQAPPGGCTIEGYRIPGETVVSVSSWIAHRHPTHFPDPDSFQPSRWISGKSDSDVADSEGNGGTDAMKKLYMPFSKGMYKCVGQAMAMVSLRIIVATLVLKYDVRLAKDATLGDMDWDDHFLIIPKKGCFLDLTPI